MKDLKTVLYDSLGVSENFRVPSALMDVLLSDKKNELLEAVASVYDFTHDSLRDYFQEVYSDRKDYMQDYTPDGICELLSGLIDEEDAVLDVCSGTGALSTSLIINNHIKRIRCEELSEASIPFLLLNMCLRNMTCEIVRKDVLTREVFTAYKLTHGERFSDIAVVEDIQDDEHWNTIISNPPYSLKCDLQKDDERFDGYVLPPKSKADYAFVLDALSRLSDTGRAYFILPHGVLFRGNAEGKIRKQLIENNLLEAVIGLPGNMFLNTSIPTAVLCFNKNKADTDVLFIDASNTFEKVGKQNVFTREHIDKILDAYRGRKSVDKFANLVSLDEIRYNEHNLNIPRYVDTLDYEEEVSFSELLDEAKSICKDVQDVRDCFVSMCRELQSNMDDDDEFGELVDLLEHIDDEIDSSIDALQCFDDVINPVAYVYYSLPTVATITRATDGKVYEAGTILLQLSVTRGQILYLDKPTAVESKYAVVTPRDGVDPFMLYQCMLGTVADFCRRYQSGLNLTVNDLKFWKLPFPVLAHPPVVGLSPEFVQSQAGGDT